MIERIIIAGSGGQGVMLLGKVLAEAAMRQGRFVTWFPAYGPEVRGGTSYCMVTISDQEIGSSYINKADTIIILNNLSLGRFKSRVKDKGLLILNSSLAKAGAFKHVKILQFPFTDIAIKLGNIKVANMAALGCYLRAKKIIKIKEILEVFRFMVPAGKTDILEVNDLALQEGAQLGYG
ncbi:2-oxoacid:ferredoxin oxidoreductase subunit gamma [bacterium]|nr:MAG: 2-oxoacid:ferredoxin oxidoreductase subunit gamma [bacterium]